MNLVEALEQRGIEYRENRSRDNEICLCCPFCTEQGTTEDTRFRLSVNTESGYMHCFNGGCGKSSRNPEYTFRELGRVLETGQLERAALKKKKRKPREVKLPEDFKIIAPQRTTDHWNGVAWKYLQQRGVTKRQIDKNKVGYSLAGEFRYRIVMPIYIDGELKGLVGRAFVRDLEPKYKNSIGEKTLYNYPDGGCRPIAVLTEGAFDALSIERVTNPKGVMDSMAVLGHSLTDKQLTLLEDYKEIVCWGDPDKAGQMGFMKIAKKVREELGKKVSMVLPREGKLEYDPSDLYQQEIRFKLANRVEYTAELEQLMKVKYAFEED